MRILVVSLLIIAGIAVIYYLTSILVYADRMPFPFVSRFIKSTRQINDHNIACDDLPSMTEINAIVQENHKDIDRLLIELQTCENNVQACKEYDKCISKNFSKHFYSSGHSRLEWDIISRCSKDQRADLVFSYTSGCESTILAKLLDNDDRLFGIPVRYYNY